MQFCQMVLTLIEVVCTLIEVVITAIIQVVREIVRTICEWVTTTIRTIREVVEKVCTWLPWPLDKLCDLVTKLIEVIETITEWVCREVIDRIFEWIEIILRYVFYLVRWICWIIDWIPRFVLDLLPCLIGVNVPKGIRIQVKILRYGDEEAEDLTTVERHIAVSDRVLRAECNVRLVVTGIEFLNAPNRMRTFDCGAGGLFSAQHVFFERNARRGIGRLSPTITVYYIEDITNARGCHIPRTDYVVLDREVSDDSLAHELGHAGDLTHSDDTTNLMNTPSRTASNLTRWQCCLIRSSRIASILEG